MVLRLHQHSIGYTGDSFYRSNDPTNIIKVLIRYDTIRYDTIAEFNVDSKAEYTA